MRHPDSDTRIWPLIWFAKYSLYFGFPLIILFLIFHDREWWMLGLSAYLMLMVAYFAWRAANGSVRVRWRIGLGGVILSSWSFIMFATFIPEGGTKICYDRFVRAHLWGPLVNLGPDPYCDGIPFDQVRTH